MEPFDPRFWEGGRRAALRGLRRDFDARIAELERRRAGTSDETEKVRLLIEIARARAELARRERELDFGLFGVG